MFLAPPPRETGTTEYGTGRTAVDAGTMRTGPPSADRAGEGALRTVRPGVRANEAVAVDFCLRDDALGGAAESLRSPVMS